MCNNSKIVYDRKNKMKLLITWGSKYSPQYSPHERQQLESLGFDVYYLKVDRNKIDEETAGFKMADIDAVVCNNLFKNNDIKNFTSLKFIKTYSAGTNYMPHDYINANGIILENAKDVYGIPIAEYIVMSILEIVKSAKAFYMHQQNHSWNRNETITELTDMVVTIIGYGCIGIETAKRLKPFGVKIRAVVGRSINEDSRQFVDEIYTADKVLDLLPDSDVVVLSLPYSPASHHLLDQAAIDSMKDDAIIVNIARGKIIEEQALIAALKNGKFRGVALDVTYNEPLDQESELWKMPNVSITPHISGLSNKVNERQFVSVYEGLKRFYSECNDK